ncbi:RNA-binding protein [Geothermobacter ehrlichii]|uniref:hypothetical protein n=1 Tax=Geothermobacter ehrlichii TaxID=213224 RepID=UPI0011E6CCCA|nr:hypothetical protein [Geothermobacter ehrlichii]
MTKFFVVMYNINPSLKHATPEPTIIEEFSTINEAQGEARKQINNYYWIKIYKNELRMNCLIEQCQNGKLLDPSGKTKKLKQH